MASISAHVSLDRGITSSRRGSARCRQTSFSARPQLRRMMPQCNVQRTAEPLSQRHPSVVCIGEALFDVLADELGKERSEVKSWTEHPGGAPCNVACGLAKLDIPVAFVSNLGKDERGDALATLMNERGVNIQAVKRVPEPTRDVYVVRSEGGDRRFDSFGQDTNTFSDCFIKSEDLPRDVIAGAQVVVMGTLGLAYPDTGAAMREAMALSKKSDTVVFIDVNWRPVFWNDVEAAKDEILPFTLQADLVKITNDEVEWLFGIPEDTALENPSMVLEKLPNARGVLVTAGGDGCSYAMRSPGGQVDTGGVPVYSVKVQDTTGAGDAFTCGFLTYLLSQEKSFLELLEIPEEVRNAVRFAAATGALTTQTPGAISAQPSLSQIEELVTITPDSPAGGPASAA